MAENDPRKKQFANLTLDQAKTVTKDGAQEDITLTIQAVLCWSEFYNGKWQSTKTSDINRGTSLGSFNSIGSNEFDRSKLRLHAKEDGGNLRVSIDGEGSSEFILYNTHSLPLGKGERGYSISSTNIANSQSTKDTSSDTFKITYTKNYIFINVSYERSLLKSNTHLPAQTIEPSHPLQNPIESPFFYEDRNHIFYVTTDEELVTISEWKEYPSPVPPSSPKKGLTIPPMVHEKYNVAWNPIDPIISDKAISQVNQKLINSEKTFRYGDVEIGAMGNLKLNQE